MQQWSKFGLLVELRTFTGTSELCITLFDLRRTLLSCAAPCWATPHPTELRRTLLSYAALYVLDNSSCSLQICVYAGGALLLVVQLSLLLRGFTLLPGGHAHGPCQSLPRLLILRRELLSIQRGELPAKLWSLYTNTLPFLILLFNLLPYTLSEVNTAYVLVNPVFRIRNNWPDPSFLSKTRRR